MYPVSMEYNGEADGLILYTCLTIPMWSGFTLPISEVTDLASLI
jgi:hypothetical protein